MLVFYLCAFEESSKYMSTIEIKAYAKINLSLDVLCKRSDGYHDIETIFHQVDLFDTVRISVDYVIKKSPKQKNLVRLSVSGKQEYLIHIPGDDNNLAVLAARLFLSRYEQEMAVDIHIHIEKRIPPFSGLGGGSADAAAVLLGLARVYNMEKSEELQAIAMLSEEIGADTPFCFFGQAALNPSLGFKELLCAGTCALGTGSGISLDPLPPLNAWVLLVKPVASLSTKVIYEGLDLSGITERPDTNALITGLKHNDYGTIIKSMVNVLEISASMEYPEIERIKSKLIFLGADKALMSGSGSTVFGLYHDEESCRNSASLLEGVLADCEIIPAALL